MPLPQTPQTCLNYWVSFDFYGSHFIPDHKPFGIMFETLISLNLVGLDSFLLTVNMFFLSIKE